MARSFTSGRPGWQDSPAGSGWPAAQLPVIERWFFQLPWSRRRVYACPTVIPVGGEPSMCIHRLRWIVAALISAMSLAGTPLHAEPVALPKLNAAIGDSSISGISSGAFMAVQFGTAWSSVIRGVGVVAGGPYWCAKADTDDFINGYTLPLMAAKGPCGTPGPPSAMSDFFAKAE